MVPIAGPIRQLLGSYIPQQRQRRMVEFMQELHSALRRIEDRLDQDFVLTDEFAGMTEDVLEQVLRRNADGKRANYAAALANSLVPERPSESERAWMMAGLHELRPSHLRLLATVASAVDLPPGQEDAYTTNLAAVMQGHLAAVPAEAIKMDWDDLTRLGILQPFNTGLVHADSLRSLLPLLTDFGRRYLSFVTTPD